MTAQLMNDIRLGIYHYLLPHYLRSYKYIDEDTYRYKYPKDINTELGMACWWDLMEFVKNKPILKLSAISWRFFSCFSSVIGR